VKIGESEEMQKCGTSNRIGRRCHRYLESRVSSVIRWIYTLNARVLVIEEYRRAEDSLIDSKLTRMIYIFGLSSFFFLLRRIVVCTIKQMGDGSTFVDVMTMMRETL